MKSDGLTCPGRTFLMVVRGFSIFFVTLSFARVCGSDRQSPISKLNTSTFGSCPGGCVLPHQ